MKNRDEIEITRELLDETEELLQFGSWAWDTVTGSVSWTSGLCALLEYTPDEMSQHTSLDFFLAHVNEEHRSLLRGAVDQALKNRSDFLIEFDLSTRSRLVKRISARGKVAFAEGSGGLKLLCINRDITALRNFEKAQERNIAELNRSTRDLEEFSYIASHDLQEPLRKISMFSERLKAKYENSLDKEGLLFIDRIMASAQNMRTLIDDLLDFSRANRGTNSFEPVNIRQVLDTVIAELDSKIEENEKPRITFHGQLPTVEAVMLEMKQLFSNILSNSMKFRNPSARVEIDIYAASLPVVDKARLGLDAKSS